MEIYKLQQQLTVKDDQLQEMNKQKTVLLKEMETLKVTTVVDHFFVMDVKKYFFLTGKPEILRYHKIYIRV